MSQKRQTVATIEVPLSAPKYEVRVRQYGPGDTEMEIWHLPSPASPQLTSAVRLAGLRGRNLELIEHRVLKRLSRAGVRITTAESLPVATGYLIPEDTAMVLGLLFRTLAPMRSRENMRAVSEGIEAMGREEAAYWLGMAMHRKNPRRVLSALRFLLTEPKPEAKK